MKLQWSCQWSRQCISNRLPENVRIGHSRIYDGPVIIEVVKSRKSSGGQEALEENGRFHTQFLTFY